MTKTVTRTGRHSRPDTCDAQDREARRRALPVETGRHQHAAQQKKCVDPECDQTVETERVRDPVGAAVRLLKQVRVPVDDGNGRKETHEAEVVLVTR
jgi:hypothetical protein